MFKFYMFLISVAVTIFVVFCGFGYFIVHAVNNEVPKAQSEEVCQ